MIPRRSLEFQFALVRTWRIVSRHPPSREHDILLTRRYDIRRLSFWYAGHDVTIDKTIKESAVDLLAAAAHALPAPRARHLAQGMASSTCCRRSGRSSRSCWS